MNGALREVYEAGRDVLKITFVTPIVDGRPRPRQWPSGLQPIGWGAVALLVLVSLATLASGPLRAFGQLTTSPNSSGALPDLSVPLLLAAVLTSFALACTAALHTSGWLRVAILVVAVSVVVLFGMEALTSPVSLGITVTGIAGLVVFTAIRSFRSFAWWEFLVVLGLLTYTLVLPWATRTPIWGLDTRPGAVEGALVGLQLLILPAIIVAGFAPAQIVVTGAEAIANRPVSRGLFWVVFAVCLAALVAASGAAILGGQELTPSAVLASLVVLVLAAGAIAALLRRSRIGTPPPPAAYAEPWGNWLYPLAVAMTGIKVLVAPIAIVIGLLQLFGQAEAASGGSAVFYSVFERDAAVYWQALIGAAALVVAWRLSRRQRLTEAIMLASFAIAVMLDAFSLVPGLDFLRQRSSFALGLLAASVALVAAAVLLIGRRFDRGRATGVLTVIALALLYPYRAGLSDPLSAALSVAPAAMLVFGLGWRMLTEAQVTYGTSTRYPQSTRVLLFLANSLLAVTGVAFVTLSRGTGTQTDPSSWGALGDSSLGEPLFLVGLVTGLWLLLRPRGAGEVSEQLTAERYDSEEVAAEEVAEAATAAEMTPGWSPNISAPNPPPMWPPPPVNNG